MDLSNFCIRRPVFTIVINAIVVLLGLWALTTLQVRQLPDFVMANVSVDTVFPGAAPALVESQVTSPLEQALAAVPGVATMTSTSRQGLSSIQLTFSVGVQPQDAVSDVRAAMGQVVGLLPAGALAPSVSQAASNAQPVLYVSFSDQRRDAMEVTDTVRRTMLPMLANIPGVAQNQLIGDRKYAIRIRLNTLSMAGHGVTVDDVTNALATQNVDVPGGQFRSQDQIISVLVSTALNRPDQFEQLVLRRGEDGFQIRIGDVGTAAVGPDTAANAIRYAGQTAVAVGVVPQSTANPLDIGKAVRAMLPALQAAAPPGMQVAIAFDTSIFVQASVDEVFKAVIVAVLLVLAVVVVFLGSLRTSIIALLTIPVSLIGAFLVMKMFGFSINIFSLLAMILAVGLVVDDAIVEVENVQRLVDGGMDPMAATFRGSEEVGFAVIATTITLASVFAPVGLVSGLVGQLFREFAFTLAATILISGFVARTLSPMLCGRLVRPKKPGGWAQRMDRMLEWLAGHYARLLRWLLRRRWLVAVLCVACIIGTAQVAGRIPAEEAPVEDDAYALIQLQGPTTASLDYLSRWAAEAEAAFRSQPEVVDALVLVGTPLPNQVLSFVVFRDWTQRTRSSTQITASIMERLSKLPGVSASVFSAGGLGGGAAGQAVQIVLRTNADYQTLAQAVDALRSAAATQATQVTNITSDLVMNTPQVVVEVDRLLAADLGVPVSSVGTTIQALLGGNRASTFNYGGAVYNVIVDLPQDLQGDPSALDRVYLRGRADSPVSLGSLVSASEVPGPAVLSHTGGQRSATIGADLRPGASAGDATDELIRIATAVLPATVRIEAAGGAAATAQGTSDLGTVFLLSLVFIYLVLSAQFESFRDPAIVLLAVPLAICGALIGLLWMGGSLNLYSGIGIITLIGLIAKHGILITEFANQLRDEGRDFEDALVEAAAMRLRPIIMTTVATVLGALPLVLATGAGAASRAQIGMVIVAGLTFGTLVSLFVIPTVYSLLSRRRRMPLVAVPAHPATGGH
jgi:multidrug efflux pump